MQKRSLLVVDDDDIVRKELEKILARNFFTPFLAKDGKSAIEIFEREDIDILLLDVKLPDINGLDILEKIKEMRPSCEVIIITGMGNQETAIQALKKGAIDYIEKPIKLEELTGAIGRAQERIAEKQTLIFKNTILVVDDEKPIVALLKRALSKEGFEVFTAYNGKEALEIIENCKIDVVITDFAMDYLNGIELLKRSKEAYEDIEFIIVTGFSERETAVEALRAGAIDYILKPVDLEELLISVHKAIERIKLNRNRLYRTRELKLSADIIKKMNEDLEKKVEERTNEIHKVEAQLFQTSKLATLGEMSAGLAHEINQPLGGISLVSKNMRMLLSREKLTREEADSCLDDIDFCVTRMTKIIQHIRTFARQEALNFIQVDINETIDNALNLLGEQLRLHDIELIREFSPDLPKIEGEPYQIEQVIINLLSNARDAMDEKSLKEIKCSKKIICISSYYCEKKDCVGVNIKDNGVGIPRHLLDKVFNPFFTTKEVGKSTGLGLSISYGIIENHKGKIEIESKEGEGTTVKLFFRINQSETMKGI